MFATARRHGAAWLVAICLSGSLGVTAAGSAAQVAPAPGIVPDEIVVGFTATIPDDLAVWAAAAGGSVLYRDDVLAWASIGFPDGAAADAAIAAALLRPDVRYAQHDQAVTTAGVPDDPFWHFQGNLRAVQAPAAWEHIAGSHDVVVAVVDTGIGPHPDLDANICGGAAFVPGETGTGDRHGHGTHVAGIVAAVTGNGIGVAGGSQSCLLDVRVLDSRGNGQTSQLAAGIRWAADAGADVISMSLGTLPGLVPPLPVADAVFHAYHLRGALLVAAAGNWGCPDTETYPIVPTLPPLPDRQSYPSLFNDVLAVAGLSQNGYEVADYSSCGTALEIAAPGTSIMSTMIPCTRAGQSCDASGYGHLTGTSMATPHVAAAAALLYAQHPGISNVAARCILDLSADNMLLFGRDTATGWGRLDMAAALELDAALTVDGLHPAFETACLAGQAAIFWGGVPDGPAPALPAPPDV